MVEWSQWDGEIFLGVVEREFWWKGVERRRGADVECRYL